MQAIKTSPKPRPGMLQGSLLGGSEGPRKAAVVPLRTPGFISCGEAQTNALKKAFGLQYG